MAEQKSAAEVNAERIKAILSDARRYEWDDERTARRIVEQFWQLQDGPQFTSERDGTARTIVNPLPWQGR